MIRPRLESALPSLCAEIIRLSTVAARTDISDQIPALHIESRCGCGDDFCSPFYVVNESRPLNIVEKNVIGQRHGETVALDPDDGYINIDLDNFGRVVTIEVLYRDEVRRTLEDMNIPARVR